MLADGGLAIARGLAVQPLPDNSTLQLGGNSDPYYAGVNYAPLILNATTSTLGSPTLPTVRFVTSAVTAGTAATGACGTSALGFNVVTAPYGKGAAGWSGVRLTLDTGNQSARSTVSLQWLMGGSYKLCYSDDASFSGTAHAGVLATAFTVKGVYDNCTGSNCLANTGYYCSISKMAANAAGSCAVNINVTSRGVSGTWGLGTWTPAYTGYSFTASGSIQNLSQKTCAMSGEAPEDMFIGTDGVDRFITPAASMITLPQTNDSLTGSAFKAFTVAACYCPDYGGCDAYGEFTQQIGVVYFFLSKICGAEACSSDYTGVLPKLNFLLRVECPPGGCSLADSNRGKLVTAAAANNIPSWDPTSGCGSATHSATFAPSGNCQGALSCTFSGGGRQDYKLFRGTSSANATWLSVLADSQAGYGVDRYDLRNLHAARVFDVCYCDDACTLGSNWFKVGSFRASPLRLVGNSHVGQADNVQALQYPGVPGMLGLSSPTSESGSLGLQAGGVVKVISDDQLTASDVACKTQPFDVSLFATPYNQTAVAGSSGAAGSDTDRVIFNGGVKTRTLVPARAGVLAICYCHLADARGCEDPTHYVLIARTTVIGPRAGQVWEFPINTIAAIKYLGFGLESTNTLRLVSPQFSCTDNSGNPRSQDPAVQAGCPGACQELSNVAGSETNIATQIAAHDAVGCDAQNANCGTAYLSGIDTSSLASSSRIQDSKTLLTFTADPQLLDGDVITLGSQVSGGTAEQLATIQGQFPYADSGTYLVGLPVARQGTTTFTTPLGWLSPSTPTFTVAGSVGQWKRRNRASTKEELMALTPRSNLRVCWAATSVGPYVAEAGTLSFVVPPLMPNTSVTPVSSVVGQSLPVIIAFETGASPRYTAGSNSMSLRLLVTSTPLFQVDFIDGSAIPTSQQVAQSAAQRLVCGKIFEELWSSDGRGFPYPKGCYYGAERSVGSLVVRDLVLLFDPGAGLAPSTKYQMVVRGTMRQGLARGSEVVQLFSMDDPVDRPYSAVELGRGALGLTPAPATSATSPLLDSLTLGTGATAGGIQSLETTVPLDFRLTGTTGRPVVAGAHLRVVLRPLTLWALGAACAVVCQPSSGHVCGDVQFCRGEATVPGSDRLNVLHVVLPPDMTAVEGTVTPTLRFYGLRLPDAGFFTTRQAAQLTDASDAFPQYIQSTGTMIRINRENVAAASVASLLVTDGDASPFRGDTGNVLWVRIAFTMTLRSVATAYTASFGVNYPPGYSCTAATSTLPNLNFFSFDQRPLRRGTLSAPTDGVWSFTSSSNYCGFNLALNSVIHAGTVLFFGLIVNNTASPLPASALNNKWVLSLTSLGEANSRRSVPPKVFTALTGTLATQTAANVPVLGKLAGLLVQPSNFTAGAWQKVRIFFTTEQSPGLSAKVLLEAPPFFSFGPSPCTAEDVDGFPYSAALPALDTEPLPQVSGCDMPKEGTILVSTTGELQAGTRYAFQVAVRNPTSAQLSAATLSGWKLTVLSADGDAVDGSPVPMRLHPAQADGVGAFGVYQQGFGSAAQLAIQVSSYLPYTLSQAWAVATIFPFKTSATVTSKLRIMAPDGYQWGADSSVAKYLAADVPGATASFPGGLPSVTTNNSTLEWASATYSAQETYGFICRLRVPDSMPVASVNAFFVELGDWSSADGTVRYQAAVVPASDVQALFVLSVDPSHTAVGQAVDITVGIRTHTTIPAGGALAITAPAGFVFPSVCTAELLLGPSGSPANLTCSSSTNSGVAQVLLAPTQGTLPAGLYSLRVSGTNPATAATNAAAATACGTEQCWRFASLSVSTDATSNLELPASVPGFAVLAQMTQAFLVPLTDAQRLAVRWTARPGYQSQVVFAMQLAQNVTTQQTLTITGPPGTHFDSNCSEGVVTVQADVFGGAGLWNSTYTAWPAAATVTSCTGDGNKARLVVAAGLVAGRLYAWRMQLAATPTQQSPSNNAWSLGFDSQASLPFPSFDLWTFTDVTLTPQTMAQSIPDAPATATVAPIFLEFRPHSTVLGGGVLTLQAPPSFAFVPDSSGACQASLSLLPDTGAERPLRDTDFHCSPDQQRPFVLTIELATGASLMAASKYRLIVTVRSPWAASPAQAWKLQSSKSRSTEFADALDEVQLPGYPVVQAASKWSVSVAQMASGIDVAANKGLAEVRLRIWAVLPVQLLQGDTLSIQGPAGFSFVNATGAGQCSPYSWEKDTTAIGALVGDLRGVSVACQDPSMITITYGGAAPVAAGATLALALDTRNPRSTPQWWANTWRLLHLRGAASQVQAAGLFQGYSILPQLEDVSTSLVGQLQAAGTTSDVQISFRVVNNCTLIRITANQPAGFSFASATLGFARTSTPAGVDVPIPRAVVIPLDTSGSSGSLSPTDSLGATAGVNVLEIAAQLLEQQNVTFLIKGVKLGTEGGTTQWTVQTFAGGNSLDRRVSLGFRLPGTIRVISQSLANELDPALNPPNRTPAEVATMSSWSPRVASPGVAQFTLRFSSAVAAGQTLVIATDAAYVLDAHAAQLFTLSLTGAALPIRFDSNVSQDTGGPGGHASLRLLDPFVAQDDIHLMLPLVAPSRAVPRGTWSFQTRDGDALPSNTNDAKTPGFALAGVIGFRVSATHAPPTGTFVITLTLSIREAQAAALSIIPPSSYTAPLNCTSSLVALCEVRGAIGARTFYLTPSSGLPFAGNLTLEALVTAPSVEPSSSAWLVQGLSAVSRQQLLGTASMGQVGWGEDRQGLALTPMERVEIQYGGIPLSTVSLAISFEVRARNGIFPKTLRILPPTTYELTCDDRFLRLVSLPRNRSICSVDPFTLSLQSGQPLPEGSHTFVLGVRVPRETPPTSSSIDAQLDTMFQVLLLQDTEDNTGDVHVLDANMQVPARQVLSLLVRAQQPALAWTFARPLSEPYVTVSLTLERPIPPSTPQLRFLAALLLELPDGFEHVITQTSDVKSLNSAFPLVDVWAQFDVRGATSSQFGTGSQLSFSKLRILRDETQRVVAGTYNFALPVRVPLVIPSKNLWYLSLCATQTCSSSGDTTGTIATTFALPGFNNDDSSPFRGYSPNGSASLGLAPSLGLLLAVLGLLAVRTVAT